MGTQSKYVGKVRGGKKLPTLFHTAEAHGGAPIKCAALPLVSSVVLNFFI